MTADQNKSPCLNLKVDILQTPGAVVKSVGQVIDCNDGHMRVASYGLRVTGCELRVTGLFHAPVKYAALLTIVNFTGQAKAQRR